MQSRTENGVTTTYTYNADGIRTSKTQGATTTDYLIDDNRDYAQVLEESHNGIVTVRYHYGDDLISQDRSGIIRYYHMDGLGSVRALSDATGNVTDTRDYTAFGEPLNQTGTTPNNYWFSGEQRDPESGHYYLRHRNMDPGTGAFTQLDSFMGIQSQPNSLHKYLYTPNDPVNFTDPSGKFFGVGVAQSIGATLAAANVVATGYSLFQLATGEKELTAREVGSEILLGLLTKGLSKHANKVKNFVPVKIRQQIENCFNNSFVAGTLVETRNGFVPIEQVQIGDYVLSHNESTGENEYQKVSHLIQREGKRQLVELVLSTGETVEATTDHPFFSQDEWVNAGDLNVGDTLTLSDGEEVSVQGVTTSTKSLKVYNLSVADTHTFYIGKDRVLVHNVNIICGFGDVTLQRSLRSSDLGLTGNIKLLKGNLLLGNGKATYQVEFLETAKAGSINFRQVLETMKRNSRNKGADTLRIEATVVNPDLLRVMERVLGKVNKGSGGKFQDAWEIKLN